jgi:hypothetical protein
VESLTDKPPRYEYASQTEPLPSKPVIRHRIAEKDGQDMYCFKYSERLKFGITNYLILTMKLSHF